MTAALVIHALCTELVKIMHGNGNVLSIVVSWVNVKIMNMYPIWKIHLTYVAFWNSFSRLFCRSIMVYRLAPATIFQNTPS